MIKRILKENAIEVLEEVRCRLLMQVDWQDRKSTISTKQIREIINEFIKEIQK